MKTIPTEAPAQVLDAEWVPFSGGELEGPRPRVLCSACRKKLTETVKTRLRPRAAPSHGATHLTHRASHQPLCFACYRAGLERDRALKAAGELDTASDARFQFALPLEPVNRSRLEGLRVERATVRAAAQAGVGRYIDKRRHAQIAARHALERIVVGLRERHAAKHDRDRALVSAIHAAELQLPEAWLPFVGVR